LLTAYLIYEFFRDSTEPEESYSVPVSILKPVRGVDPEAYENFASFCRQDYGEYELLFGVADPADPVVWVVARLQRDFPTLPIRLFVAPPYGANCKASILHYLAGQARHGVLVVSDSDVRVTPDYLRRVVGPLRNRDIGMVTCLYRGEEALTFTARLEALYMGATFVPLVLAARKFVAMRLGLGATMVVRRYDLSRIAGLRPSPTTWGTTTNSATGSQNWVCRCTSHIMSRRVSWVRRPSATSGTGRCVGCGTPGYADRTSIPSFH